MSAEVWIAGAGLIITILISAATIVWKLGEVKASVLEVIAEHREQLDAELTAMRTAAYEEYKILRKELNDTSAQTYREFGETVQAVREKINQVELWVRDQLSLHLLKKDFERDHDHIRDALKTLSDTVDRRFDSFEKKLDQRSRHEQPAN